MKLTAKEALERLAKETVPNPYTYDENHNNIDIATIKQHLEKIEAKETPLKLEYEGNEYGINEDELVYDTAICPNCRRRFEIDNEEHYNYCPTCGQKLNLWEHNTIKISDEEKVILKNIDKKYKWIARDLIGKLCVFSEKPSKVYSVWDYPPTVSIQYIYEYEPIKVFNHLFTFIKWKDKEPYRIEDLLKM